MYCKIRRWELSDAKALADALSNKKIQDKENTEKSGSTYEGTLRSNAVKNGMIIDMKMYSLLKEEMLTE